MSLEVLQWSKESREDVNFVMEGKVYFNQATESVASSSEFRVRKCYAYNEAVLSESVISQTHNS